MDVILPVCLEGWGEGGGWRFVCVCPSWRYTLIHFIHLCSYEKKPVKKSSRRISRISGKRDFIYLVSMTKEKN